MKKTFILGIMIFLVSAVCVVAIDPPGGASTDLKSTGSFAASTAGSEEIFASNVSLVNLQANQTTYKWAGFYGNVSGNLSLGWDSSILYDFGASAESVLATTNNAFAWSTLAAGTAQDVDDLWHAGATGANDNATSHYSNTGTIATVDSVPYVTLNPAASGFESGIFDDGTNGAKTNIAFGTDVVDGGATDFRGGTSDFELMVPIDAGQGNSETYYFYVIMG